MTIRAALFWPLQLAIVMASACDSKTEGPGFPISPEARSEWSPELLRLFDQIYNDATEVSIVRLLADPRQYDGRAVTVWGVFNSERESSALYLNRESYEYRIDQNAIPITSNHTLTGESSKMNGHYVWLVGIYESDSVAPVGFNGMGNGHLRDVLPMRPAQVRLRDREAAPPREFDGVEY
jgi:hypothetical protein